MLKTLLSATAISGLMISGAFAQATSTPGSTSTPSGTPPAASPATPPASSTGSTSASSASSGGGQFVAAQKPDQWLASKFKGTDVIGNDNEKIGDVNDVLFDKSGKIHAVIVGVGGFLGIGEKDVALDMNAFQIVPASTTNTAGTGGSGANTGANTGAAGTAGGSSSASNDPNNVKLKISMTKDQLKNAPSFEQYRATSNTGSGAGAGSGAGSRPAGAPATAR
jgi:sporulation protein YlmC with PRC-barrel domain